jgi:hypothetical protein
MLEHADRDGAEQIDYSDFVTGGKRLEQLPSV